MKEKNDRTPEYKDITWSKKWNELTEVEKITFLSFEGLEIKSHEDEEETKYLFELHRIWIKNSNLIKLKFYMMKMLDKYYADEEVSIEEKIAFEIFRDADDRGGMLDGIDSEIREEILTKWVNIARTELNGWLLKKF